MRFKIGRIGDHRSSRLHLINQGVRQRVHRVVESEIFARDSNSGITQAVRIEKLRVVLLHFAIGVGSSVIALVRSGERSQQDRRLTHSSGHGTGCVLVMSDWNDSSAADQPQRRLDTNNPVCR